jgi:hypothetical protein
MEDKKMDGIVIGYLWKFLMFMLSVGLAFMAYLSAF